VGVSLCGRFTGVALRVFLTVISRSIAGSCFDLGLLLLPDGDSG
jgi:hypothetical protein